MFNHALKEIQNKSIGLNTLLHIKKHKSLNLITYGKHKLS